MGNQKLPSNVLSKIKKTETCWLWTGCLVFGYGHVYVDRRQQKAHRVVFERLVGPIQKGLCLDHICRNRACVNPAHLRPVTLAENSTQNSLSPAALNMAKTHCKRGHLFCKENTYFGTRNGRPWRKCRLCVNPRQNELKRLKKLGISR